MDEVQKCYYKKRHSFLLFLIYRYIFWHIICFLFVCTDYWAGDTNIFIVRMVNSNQIFDVFEFCIKDVSVFLWCIIRLDMNNDFAMLFLDHSWFPLKFEILNGSKQLDGIFWHLEFSVLAIWDFSVENFFVNLPMECYLKAMEC